MTSEAAAERQEIAMRLLKVVIEIDSCQCDISIAGDEITSAEMSIEKLSTNWRN